MSSPAEVYREFMARGGVVDLSDRLKLVLTGADRARYLHGQVTSNVQTLAPGQARPACVTTAKGKLCAEVAITATGGALFVDAEGSLRETLPARLERYIIADDAVLAELPPETRLFHFLSARPDWLGTANTGDLPPLTAATRFGRPGWDWWTDAATAARLRADIESHVVPIDEPLAESLRIEAGVPRWGRELNEDTLPPEAGLERTHVDYHKGCYIGQEVISLLKSIGHVNRQLTGFTSASGAPLTAGAKLFAPADNARPVGVLTSTAFSFALEKPIALGYLRRGSPSGELLARPAEPTGAEAVVTIRELPICP